MSDRAKIKVDTRTTWILNQGTFLEHKSSNINVRITQELEYYNISVWGFSNCHLSEIEEIAEQVFSFGAKNIWNIYKHTGIWSHKILMLVCKDSYSYQHAPPSKHPGGLKSVCLVLTAAPICGEQMISDNTAHSAHLDLLFPSPCQTSGLLEDSSVSSSLFSESSWQPLRGRWRARTHSSVFTCRK